MEKERVLGIPVFTIFVIWKKSGPKKPASFTGLLNKYRKTVYTVNHLTPFELIGFGKIGSVEMFKKNSNVHGGFTPATWLPPNAITPGKVITALSYCAGAVRGDRHCPLLQRGRPFFILYIMLGILQSRKIRTLWLPVRELWEDGGCNSGFIVQLKPRSQHFYMDGHNSATWFPCLSSAKSYVLFTGLL